MCLRQRTWLDGGRESKATVEKKPKRLKILKGTSAEKNFGCQINFNVSILWFRVLKSVILSTAPIPGHLFCIFGPLNFPATAISNYDVNVHCRAQAPAKNVQTKMVPKESSVPKLLALSRNIRVIISQNQARMRCNWVRMNPKDFQSLGSTST